MTIPPDIAQLTQDRKLDLILWYLTLILQREQLIMSEQAQENQDVAALTVTVNDMATQTGLLGQILTEVQAIQAQLASGQTVDLTNLNALVGQAQTNQAPLDAAVSALGSAAAPPSSSSPPATS